MSEESKTITLKQAKPSQADLEMLQSLLVAFGDIIDYGYLPECDGEDGEPEEEIDIHDDGDAAKALRALVSILSRGSLDRCVWTLCMLMNPANRVVNADVDYVDFHPHTQRAFEIVRKMAEFHTDPGLTPGVLSMFLDDARELWAEMQEKPADE